MINVCIVLQDRVIQEELILSIPLSGGTLFLTTIPWGLYFTIYSRGVILDVLCTMKYNFLRGQYWKSLILIFIFKE